MSGVTIFDGAIFKLFVGAGFTRPFFSESWLERLRRTDSHRLAFALASIQAGERQGEVVCGFSTQVAGVMDTSIDSGNACHQRRRQQEYSAHQGPQS